MNLLVYIDGKLTSGQDFNLLNLDKNLGLQINVTKEYKTNVKKKNSTTAFRGINPCISVIV